MGRINTTPHLLCGVPVDNDDIKKIFVIHNTEKFLYFNNIALMITSIIPEKNTKIGGLPVTMLVNKI